MKALKAKRKKGKYKPKATPSTTIFRKGSASSRDDLTAATSTDIDEVKKSLKEKVSHKVRGNDMFAEFRTLILQLDVTPIPICEIPMESASLLYQPQSLTLCGQLLPH